VEYRPTVELKANLPRYFHKFGEKVLVSKRGPCDLVTKSDPSFRIVFSTH